MTEKFFYRVRFTLAGVDIPVPGKTFWEFQVSAFNEAEAIARAKYEAGKAKIPILETRIEVR